MTAVERLARELHGVYVFGVNGPSTCAFDMMLPSTQQLWLALARHVLRRERAAVRRARGKGLGYVAVSSSGRSIVEPTVKDKPWRSAVIGSRCARVVAVPRKGGRK